MLINVMLIKEKTCNSKIRKKQFSPKTLKVVVTSQNTHKFYFRNQYSLVFQAYCKKPRVLNFCCYRVIHPQNSYYTLFLGDKKFPHLFVSHVTSLLSRVANLKTLNHNESYTPAGWPHTRTASTRHACIGLIRVLESGHVVTSQANN